MQLYYVGVDGLSSVLITSNEGHILIDGGIAALQRMSGAQIAASSESSQALKLGSSLSNDSEACRKYAEDA